MGKLLKIFIDSKKLLKKNNLENNQIEIIKMENTKCEIKNNRLYRTKWDLLSRIIEGYRQKKWKCRIRHKRHYEKLYYIVITMFCNIFLQKKVEQQLSL